MNKKGALVNSQELPFLLFVSLRGGCCFFYQQKLLLSFYNTKIFQYAQPFLQGASFLFVFIAHVAHLLFGV